MAHNMDYDTPLVISYENDMKSNSHSQLFKKTLERHKWDFMFVGEGTKWEGFKTRILGYYNILQTLSEEKLVVLSDARDVVCLRDSQLFHDLVKNVIDTKIIISAECFLNGHLNWSEEEIAEANTKNPNSFYNGILLNEYWSFYNKKDDLPMRKYLNAGLIVGKVKHLQKAFKWLVDNHYNDDQLGFANYANKYPELVHLDHEAVILHSSTGFVCGSLYHYPTQSKDAPTFTELFGLSCYFLHIPGLNGSQGQLNVYKVIYNIMNDDMIKSDMFSLYNITFKSNRGSFYKTNKINN